MLNVAHTSIMTLNDVRLSPHLHTNIIENMSRTSFLCALEIFIGQRSRSSSGGDIIVVVYRNPKVVSSPSHLHWVMDK